MYPRAAGIIAQSNEIKNNLLTEFRDARVEVIGNPVRKIKNGKHLKREKIVLNVGALIKRKGQKNILDLAQSDSDKNWKYVILGEGPMREELEKEICKRNLQDRFVLPGSVSNVNEWLFRASIFVFPSRLEGLPNALIEAMRAGLPCVSFNCISGPSELIEDGINGYLVEVDDIERLIEVTNKLKMNESLRQRIGSNAMNSVERFNIEEISSQLLSFFTDGNQYSQKANRYSQIIT
jgi:GalNAc-alpha-(1->4)-GalNAc-alpha-(1->3)-diNAcBac-PP-undecaprenol alpha-1,4-N-acetyl-D-galactosaminyltransferase